jgi:hypothetical protein
MNQRGIICLKYDREGLGFSAGVARPRVLALKRKVLGRGIAN